MPSRRAVTSMLIPVDRPEEGICKSADLDLSQMGYGSEMALEFRGKTSLTIDAPVGLARLLGNPFDADG